MPVSDRDRAVVLGGGVAGLLAASVLADRYADVVIVERDVLAPHPGHRRGVPQGRHVHGFLPSGLRLVEQLLPGFTAGLVGQGALLGDILGNVRWYLQGNLLRQAATGLTFLSAGRPLIEAGIRDAVRRRGNITVLDGHDIVGLRATEDRRRITGVRAVARDGAVSRMLRADLVIDAGGRGSRATRWLAELGYPPPAEDVVGIDLSYATRVFAVPSGTFGDDLLVASARFPGQRRSAISQRLEGGRALVTLAGILGERPPADLKSFAMYARSLPIRDTYEIVRAGTPLGEAATFRCPTYVRRRFERLDGFPEGLLVIGDAACSFNPVYGQGMTVAASAAMALRDELAAPDGPDPSRFYAAQSALLDAPWALAAGADLAQPGVTGPDLPPSPLTGDYLARLQRAAADDADLATAFIRVTSLVDPPAALLAAPVRERVERHSNGRVAVPRQRGSLASRSGTR
jgi:2-polyprenyl-6-methoxyphenol hydroxylase-like FAD-dependent oxidoreductase